MQILWKTNKEKINIHSKFCKACSSQFLINKIQFGNPSYQKILDVYDKFYTKKFYNKKYRLLISFQQVICPICKEKLIDLKKQSKKIHLHHIDFNKLNDDRINLVFYAIVVTEKQIGIEQNLKNIY